MIEGLKPYAEYKEPRTDWLGQVPVHWDVRRTKLLLREVDSRSTTGKEQLLRVSQYTGVTQRKAADGSEAPDTRARSLIGYKRVSVNDLVINIMLAWNGSLGTSLFEGIVSPAYCVYRFNQEALPLYYNELFRIPLYKRRIKTASTGVIESRLRLYSDDLGRIEALVPPPDEQAAIVRFLDYANRKINDFIRAKRKLIVLLNEQKQAIIHRAVTLGLNPDVPFKPSGVPWLGDIPKHWEVLRLGRVIKLITGFPFPSEGFSQTDSGVRLLRGINVTPVGIRWDSTVRWKRAHSDGLDEFLLGAGDIVLGMDRPIIRSGVRAAVINPQDTPSLLLQRVARLRPKERITGPFLLLLLQGSQFAEYIAPIFTGISVPHLSPEQIKNFKIMLPPVGEQEAIVDSITSQTSNTNAAIVRTEREIALMQEYRTRLTTDIVTGKLDVRDVAVKIPASAADSSRERLWDVMNEELEFEEAEP